MKDTIAVITDDPIEDILAAQNSAAWSVNVSQWEPQLKYLLCVDKAGGGMRALLLCKIAGFFEDHEATKRSKGKRSKYAIEFREYARIDSVANLERSRNPVRIGALADLLPEMDLPVDSEFLQLGPKEPNAPRFSYSRKVGEIANEGLSVAEAKRGLSVRYEVPEEAITITIQV